MYGISPGAGVDDLAADLRPVLSLRARVSFVKRLAAGARLSYGLRHECPRTPTWRPSRSGTPTACARRLEQRGGDVLIGGRRWPIVGIVTMDQLMVDCGDDEVRRRRRGRAHRGARATSGSRPRSGPAHLGTIGDEIVCGIGPRVPRGSIGASPAAGLRVNNIDGHVDAPRLSLRAASLEATRTPWPPPSPR